MMFFDRQKRKVAVSLSGRISNVMAKVLHAYGEGVSIKEINGAVTKHGGHQDLRTV